MSVSCYLYVQRKYTEIIKVALPMADWVVIQNRSVYSMMENVLLEVVK